MKKNIVFIATSIDGYIADKDGGLNWLQSVPNPTQDDMGFVACMESVDAIVMGRTTFETVLGFDVAWPYSKPVFVLSSRMKEIPESYRGKAFLVKGQLSDVLFEIHNKGFHKLYIDGGTTIQSFLKEDLIDEMILTTIPVLLGGGAQLFGTLDKHTEFDLLESSTFLGQITQRRYRRRR